ncbi:xyloside xylosyltransferase 1 isoform X3 [Cricetulus griseus]|uniref:Xyloside xylosyltransferase 1 isoform X6 n=1 Tax=Cricetulus griseus TaxID=10029 RepID=A0A9J7JPI8_CRIGR|nr:xyloside xylosyltransferase 1 isoform X6 [Cricetulus griseus]XP_035310082.1 xyloside xylosyltransferase 1 isoform X3 [Cricetulus griseus]
MDLLRAGAACARAMARLGAVRSHYCALLLAAALAVCAFYYLGSGRETFSSATKRLKEARAGAAAPTPPAFELARGSAAPASGAKAKSLEGGAAVPVDYHLLMMFTKAEHNAALQAKARVALRSLLRLAKFEAHEVLNLHFVSEEASREVAKALLRELLPPAAGFKCKVIFHDVAVLTDKLFPIVEAMQKHFSAGSGTYYSDSIFFLSVAMHQILPKEILRIIQLDLDLKYKTNIRELFEEFDNFLPGAVIGIAREMQPVYSSVPRSLYAMATVTFEKSVLSDMIYHPGTTIGKRNDPGISPIVPAREPRCPSCLLPSWDFTNSLCL